MPNWRPPNPLQPIRCPRTIKRLTSKVKVNKTTGCWCWTGFLHARGYGQLWYNGKAHQAHRVAYAIFNGGIPDAMTIDHTCHNPKCCNPDHLVAECVSDNCSKNQHCQRYKECQDDIPI